ncbi:MAG: hypothetical protein AAF497_06155 [Planctomycetota bacterium]
MNERIADPVRDYLMPSLGGFWAWDEDGRVAVWTEGATIGWQEEIRAICERLHPHGLPPFGSVLLFLAATRNRFDENLGESVTFLKEVREWTAIGRSINELRELCRPLTSYADWTQTSRVIAAEMIFEKAPDRTSAALAERVVASLRRGMTELFESAEQINYDVLDRFRDLNNLLVGLADFRFESLELRSRTGLDDLVAPAQAIELPDSQRARALISELREDQQLSGVARIAQRLLSLVTIPRPYGQSETPPIGGYSDISNRGNPDQLLVSELANDDLVLAVRIAMNEALYLRRESPPANPPQHRTILIDCGIRSWGIPRIFLTAVGLALTATAGESSDVEILTGAGETVVDSDLTRREGIVQHLERLQPELDLSACLPAFVKQLSADRPEEGEAEPVILMTEDAWATEEVQRSISQLKLPSLYCGVVARSGRFELWHRRPEGIKRLVCADLELDELLAKPVRNRVVESNELLPDIQRVNPFPLTMPHNVDVSYMWEVADYGVVAVPADGRILLWTESKRGAIQLGLVTTPFKVQSACVDRDSIFVCGVSRGKWYIVQIKLKTREVTEHPTLVEFANQKVVVRQGTIFYITNDYVELGNLLDPHLVQNLPVPGGLKWQYGRFFKSPRGAWFVLSNDGMTAEFHLVVRIADSIPPMLTIFEHPLSERLFGVAGENGQLFDLEQKKAVGQMSAPSVRFDSAWVSPDGRTVRLSGTDGWSAVFDTETGVPTAHRYSKPSAHPRIFGAKSIVHQKSLRHHFRAISINNQSILLKAKNKLFEISWTSQQQLSLVPWLRGRVDALPQWMSFEQCQIQSMGRIKCKVATWSDGSRAMIDSRGLLHLSSADTTIPTLTLVLNEGMLSGWCSNRTIWGADYFVAHAEEEGLAERADELSIWGIIQRFASNIDAKS